MSVITNIAKLMFDGNEREVRRLRASSSSRTRRSDLLALPINRARGPMFRERIQEFAGKAFDARGKSTQARVFAASRIF